MNEKSPEKESVLWLSAAHVITDLYLPAITAILPVLIATYGFSYFLAGLLVTAYNMTSSLMQPVFGWLSDTHGFVIHISVSLLISAIFLSAMGLSGDFYLLFLFASLAALGHAAFHPNALSLVNRLCTPDTRGKVTATFVVGGNLGYAIGPVLTATIILYFGLSGLPLLIIPAAIMAIVLWRSFPGKIIPDFHVARIPSSGSPGGGYYRPILTLFCASTLRAWVIFCAIAFFPVLLMTRGLDLLTADLLITGMLLAGVAGQVAGGYLSDTYGRKEFVIGGSLLAIPALYGFMFTTGITSVISLFIFGFAIWSGLAVMLAIAHEMIPGQVGFTSGIMLGAALGAGGIGVAITGIFADSYSLIAALQLLPLLILLAAILMFFLRYPWKSRTVFQQ